MYEYHWLPGTLVPADLLSNFSQLYCDHYGTWGEFGPNPGKTVRLSPDRLRTWLVRDSLVVWATAFGQLIGYAIAVHAVLPFHGEVSWVTQLVVHEEHRKQDVGKTLLFTIWRFTDYFAWGILSANPYAIRALEKATRRRCQPTYISQHASALLKLGTRVVPYMDASTEIVVSAGESRIDTKFFLDHSKLPTMLASATNDEKPWTLGTLPLGWEWFAFTFHNQEQIRLNPMELQEMLTASDRATKLAYSRMLLETDSQTWARGQETEVDFIIQNCGIGPGSTVLDFGCGKGRHSLLFGERGIAATGIDYISAFIDDAQQKANARAASFATFKTADCRTVELNHLFDAAICLYDVIGSYADDRENVAILANLARHVKPGGLLLLSVMNMELTERIAQNWFSIASEPDKLLDLPASRIMEKTGNVFDPKFYMIDRDTRLVYRKEQFAAGEDLFEEMIVRDRRYTDEQIRHYCSGVRLEVVWTRFVRTGKWHEPLERSSDKAKEILVLCRKTATEGLQKNLFG